MCSPTTRLRFPIGERTGGRLASPTVIVIVFGIRRGRRCTIGDHEGHVVVPDSGRHPA